jgi:RNA polymerase sigma factor (sigma-70 family)
MDEHDWLAERFEESRPRLRAVAYRVLGSSSEAEDAVQEAWLRLSRSDTSTVDNLDGWLTTVVARVSLNMLRSRAARREELIEATEPPGPADTAALAGQPGGTGPEEEAVLADSVGLALLVVLDTLTPAERLAFVLHDMFAMPFDEIAPIVERSPAAARQLASRARRRVQQGDRAGPVAGQAETAAARRKDTAAARRKDMVAAFLAASREGDFGALLEMLDPDIVLRADAAAARMGAAAEVRGAEAVAGTFSGRARAAELAVIDGLPGLIWAQGGKTRVAFDFTVIGGTITAIEMIADPELLAQLDIVPG